MRRYWATFLLLGVVALLGGAIWSGGAGASAGSGKPGAPLSLPTTTPTLTPPPLTGCLVSAPSGPEGHFIATSATGPNDVWAVGSVHGLQTTSLISHWNGTGWSNVAGAGSAGWTLGHYLAGVVALA